MWNDFTVLSSVNLVNNTATPRTLQYSCLIKILHYKLIGQIDISDINVLFKNNRRNCPYFKNNIKHIEN